MASAEGGNPDVQTALREWEEPDRRGAVLGSPRPSSPGWTRRPPRLLPPQLTAALSRRQLISSPPSTRRSDPHLHFKAAECCLRPPRLQRNITHARGDYDGVRRRWIQDPRGGVL